MLKYFFILLIITFISTDAKPSVNDSLHYFTGTFTEAKAESKKLNKPLMTVFSTSWCTWCKKMKTVAFADEKIIRYINSHFILLEQNAETTEGKIIASSFGVSSYPTIVFLSPEEKPLMTSEGYQEKEGLMQLMKSVLNEK